MDPTDRVITNNYCTCMWNILTLAVVDICLGWNVKSVFTASLYWA